MKSVSPIMSDDQWFLTEGNGSLTVRIREGLKVGEQASGFLALDDSRRINQWFRFYFNEQRELWMACLHGFVMQSGDSSELRRFKLTSDTKVKLLSNEISVCKDPFHIDENAQFVIVKPLFNSYVADTPEQVEATLPTSPIVDEGAVDDGAAELTSEHLNEPSREDVTGSNISRQTGFRQISSNEVNSIGNQRVASSQKTARSSGYADLNDTLKTPAHSFATGEREADDLLDTVRIPAIKADDIQVQDDIDMPGSQAKTRSESDFYISSLWAEHAAGDKAGKDVGNRGRISGRRMSTAKRQGLWKPRFTYLGAGVVTGCLLSALLFSLVPFNDDSVGGAVRERVAGETYEEAPENTNESQNHEQSLVSAVDNSAANTDIERPVLASEVRDESQLSIDTPDSSSEDLPRNTVAADSLDSDTFNSDTFSSDDRLNSNSLNNDISGNDTFDQAVNDITELSEQPANAQPKLSAEVSGSIPQQEGDNFKEVFLEQVSVANNAKANLHADKATINTNTSATSGNSRPLGNEQNGFEDDWRILRARESLKNGDIISPPGKNAVAYLQSYLEDFPKSEAAMELLNQCANELTRIAEELYQQGEAFEARNTLEEVLVFEPGNEKANSLWVAWHGSAVN